MKVLKCHVIFVVRLLALVYMPFSQAAILDQSSFSFAGDGWSPQIGAVGADKGVAFPGGVGFSAQAQTFTAGVNGILDSVGVHLQSFIPEVADPLFMALRSTTDGIPASDSSGNLGVAVITDDFYAVNLSGISWGDVRRVDFSHLNIQVSAGTTYAIVLYSAAAVPETGPFSGYSAPYGWDGARTVEQYDDGRAFISIEESGLGPFAWFESASDHDHFFQTFVTPQAIPVPGSALFLLSGLGFLTGLSIVRLR